MGTLQKKRCTTAKKVLAYRGEAGQNADTASLALRLGVVLYLPILVPETFCFISSEESDGTCNEISQSVARGCEMS